ncbi:hypothetical protein GNF80_10800 [Clostridium perfringens]|nr:hypothetical protein [Clostridium perfringens]
MKKKLSGQGNLSTFVYIHISTFIEPSNFNTGITDMQILLISFLACAIVFGSASFLLYYLNIKKQNKIEEELNKEEYDSE